MAYPDRPTASPADGHGVGRVVVAGRAACVAVAG